MAGKGGGAWKVAYADFVTAMMAFFLVMWITAQSKPVKQAIVQYFEDPLGSKRGSTTKATKAQQGAPAFGPYASGRGPYSSNKPSLRVDPKADATGPGKAIPPKLRVFQDTSPTRTTGTMVIFPEASTELDAAAQEQLKALVPLLLGKPNKIEIRGHAAKRLVPKAEDSADPWSQSHARCLAVMKFLMSQGLPAERMRLSQDGDTEPYTLRTEPAWHALNSRVEVFAVSGYAQELERTRKEKGGFFSEVEDPAAEPEPMPNEKKPNEEKK